MSEAIDNSQFHILNEAGDFRLDTHVEQDVSEIIKDNAREAEQSNGFTDGRTMRKTASLTVVDYLNALSWGYALDESDPYMLQKELNRYLKERGRSLGVQTVRHILTPGGNANIIVR